MRDTWVLEDQSLRSKTITLEEQKSLLTHIYVNQIILS